MDDITLKMYLLTLRVGPYINVCIAPNINNKTAPSITTSFENMIIMRYDKDEEKNTNAESKKC